MSESLEAHQSLAQDKEAILGQRLGEEARQVVFAGRLNELEEPLRHSTMKQVFPNVDVLGTIASSQIGRAHV